jgi:hypothetical protein
MWSTTSPLIPPTSIQSPTVKARVEARTSAPETQRISSFVATTMATATAAMESAKVRSCGAQMRTRPMRMRKRTTFRLDTTQRRRT